MNDGIWYFFPAFQGILSSVIKDFTSSKEKHGALMGKEDPKENIRELSAVFSNTNFTCNDSDDKPTVDESQLELNIGKTMQHICATKHFLKRKMRNSFYGNEFTLSVFYW